jgi:CBS domain-containing protein
MMLVAMRRSLFPASGDRRLHDRCMASRADTNVVSQRTSCRCIATNGGSAMNTREIMTADPACCTPEQTVREAARLMREYDCGCAPVVDDLRTRRLIGVVTDRDLAVRTLADGKGPETLVREVMSEEASCCTPEDDLREVERVMVERQVRRVPIVDGAGACVGIVAQADLARNSGGGPLSERDVARVLERISEPTPWASRAQADVGSRPTHQA